jgi:hypothetical protein
MFETCYLFSSPFLVYAQMTQHYRFVVFIVLVAVVVLVICQTGNLIAKDPAQQKIEACGTYDDHPFIVVWDVSL